MHETIITTVAGALIVTITIAVAKHLNNSDRHPNKKDIVFREVCEKTQDCIESKIDNLQQLCEQEFKHVKDLIRHNEKE